MQLMRSMVMLSLETIKTHRSLICAALYDCSCLMMRVMDHWRLSVRLLGFIMCFPLISYDLINLPIIAYY